jgi:hypothetical protein
VRHLRVNDDRWSWCDEKVESDQLVTTAEALDLARSAVFAAYSRGEEPEANQLCGACVDALHEALSAISTKEQR